MATGTHHYDALIGIKQAIVNLELVGPFDNTPLPAERVYLRELWSDRNVTLPCVVVSKAPMPETREISDTRDNRLAYPCMAVILAAADQEVELTEGPTAWRQALEEIFNFKHPPELLDSLSDEITLGKTEWHPLDAIDIDAFDKNLFVSAAVILVWVWKTR